MREKEQESRAAVMVLEGRVAEVDASVRQTVKQAQEEASGAREEALGARIAEKRARERAERLAQQVKELLGEAERMNMLSMQHAVDAGKRVELRAQVSIGCLIVMTSVVLALVANFAPLVFGQQSFGAVLVTISCIALIGTLSFFQFWVFPARFFGRYVVRKKDEAFYRKAKELNVSTVIDIDEIDWTARAVKTRASLN